MYSAYLILYSYFVIVFSCFIFYCVGDIILKRVLGISLPVSAKRIFTSSLIGISVCVLCYSIVRTQGNTSSLLFIPLIGFYFWHVKRKRTVQSEDITTGENRPVYVFCVYSILISAILYSLFCYANLDGVHHFRPVEGDDYSYGMLSQYLNRGYENLAFSKNFWFDSSHSPYHYFEIWLNALLYKIFHLNSTWTYSLILPAVLYTVMFWGLMSIVEQYKKLNLLTGGICFILLFTTEISIVFSWFGESVFPYPNQYCSGLILTKVAPVSLFLLAVILLLINRKNMEALLVALSMPAVSFVMTPVVFAVTGYLILKDMTVKRAVRNEYLIPWISVLCLFAFYVLSGEQSASHNKFPSVSEMKLRLFITNPITFGIRYIFPVIIILLIDFKRFFGLGRRYCAEIFLFFTVSTAFSVILRPVMPNAVQFTTLSYYGTFNILFPALILFYGRNRLYGYKKTVLIFVFITGYSLNIMTTVSFFMNNHRLSSADRLQYEDLAVKNIQDGTVCIGIIRSDRDVANWGNYNTASQNYLTSFLDTYKNDVIYYSIVIGTKGISEETAFSLSFREARKNNPLLTQDDFRTDFIKQTGINYILVYAGGKIPENLSDKLQLIAKDTDTEECLYRVTGI